MNKLFATIVLAAFALSGCIKEDDSYKELLPLQPGMNIYNMTMTQNAVAMQPANAGIRLALLLAEAAKQKDSDTELKDVDLTKLRSSACCSPRERRSNGRMTAVMKSLITRITNSLMVSI